MKRPASELTAEGAGPAAAVKQRPSSAPPGPALDRLLDAAVRAVSYASRISNAVQADLRRNGRGALTKTDASPVTVADYAVQCLITEYLGVATGDGAQLRLLAEEDAALLDGAEGRRGDEIAQVAKLLNEHFPFEEAAALAGAAGAGATPRQAFTEEDTLDLLRRSGDAGGREGAFWVLDPIDGTKGFIRDAQYAIGLGYVVDGAPAMSAMCCPNLPALGGCVEQRAEGAGWTFFGLGDFAGALEVSACLARLTGPAQSLGGLDWRSLAQRLRIDSPCPVSEATVCESFEASHRGGDFEILPRSEKLRALKSLRLDSMSKYGLVARGDAHIYLRGGLKPKVECAWDHCAGVPILLGAGGKVTDLRGKSLDFGCGRMLSANEGVLATNRALHDTVLEEVAKLRAAAAAAS